MNNTARSVVTLCTYSGKSTWVGSGEYIISSNLLKKDAVVESEIADGLRNTWKGSRASEYDITLNLSLALEDELGRVEGSFI